MLIRQNLEARFFVKLQMVRSRQLLKNIWDLKASSNTRKSMSGFLNVDNMNQNIRIMEYAVRGPLLVRAMEIEKELTSGSQKSQRSFNEVIKANLGDCHAMGQQPITFYRQVLALVSYPQLLSSSDFPSDTISRAKELLSVCKGGSVGSYTDSFGIELIRKHVAESIKKRDKFDSNHENIMLSSGATESIKNVLKLFNEKYNGKLPGVMIPIPQYPLYSATLAEFGMSPIKYYLDEKHNWGLDVKELQRSYDEVDSGINPRLLVVINPGNPTGQVLTKENIQEIIKFAYSKKLIILADEVYQANIYGKNCEFHSFKKVTNEMGEPYNKVELASFMSCSKGYMGECGLRGGYCEFVNMDPDVKLSFNKCISATLCSTSLGQCLLDCVVKPPEKGDPSYDLFEKEKNEILDSLKEKAGMVYEFFNSVKGFSCNEVQGAMYAFPQIEMPPKAVKEAEENNMKADQLYAFQLLENTGICIIPGSGFQQMPGTYHFRTTILPKVDKLKQMLDTIENFHKKFLEKYS